MKKWNILIVVFCSLLIGCGTKYQVKVPNPYADGIDTRTLSTRMDVFIPALMAEERIPGISISIVEDSNLVLSKSYGVRNVNDQAAINHETVYEFASLSKPIFALAILQLSEKGVIDLDKPLLEYLKFPGLADDERNSLITARIVLSHSTGLPNWSNGKQVSLAFTPGERFSYSGMSYFFLQRVLEKLTGIPLQQIVEEEVFSPLKMTNSSFIWNNKFIDNRSVGHSLKGKYSRDLRAFTSAVSASSLISTSEDYSKFLSHILIEYKKRNPIITKMVVPITQVKNDEHWGRISWGLGWGIEETSEGTNIWHWGNNNEFRSLVVANLERGVGLVYVANGASGLKPIPLIIQNTIGGIHPLTRFKYVH